MALLVHTSVHFSHVRLLGYPLYPFAALLAQRVIATALVSFCVYGVARGVRGRRAIR